MKKGIAVFVCFIYLISSQACFAAGNLYFLKNTDKTTVSGLVEKSFAKNKKYTITKKNPYLVLSNKNNFDYIIVILQPSGSNLFYYYQSNKNFSADRTIKKMLKKQNIVFEQSQNQMYLSTFEKQAQKVLTNTTATYNFEEPEKQANTASTANKKEDNKVLKGYVGQVAKGSAFNAYLQTPINTATANVGDSVIAVLTENWLYNGHVIAPQGSVVSGEITKARHAAYGSRNGQVLINFTKITTPENKVYEVSTEKIDFTITNDGKFKSVARNAMTGVIIGAIGGLLVGALSSSANAGISTAIGAGIGAGTALAGSAVEKGVDAEIPTYTELELMLTKPLNIVIGF